MAKNEIRTMEVVLAELNTKVDAYNLSTSNTEKATLTDEIKKLEVEYNELSLLTAYSKCMEAELPIKALVEMAQYDTVSHKDTPHKEVQADGSKLNVITRSVVEKKKMFDLVKFIEWAAERNKQIAHSKDWRVKIGDAKKTIKTEWKKYLASKGDSHSISNRQLKIAMQAMFDSLIFIPTEKGENSVIADKDIAVFAFGFANKLNPQIDDEDVNDGDILPESNWKVILMKTTRSAVIGKKLIVGCAEDEEEAAQEAVEASEAPATEEAAAE